MICDGSGRALIGGYDFVGQGNSLDVQNGWVGGAARQANAFIHQYGEPDIKRVPE